MAKFIDSFLDKLDDINQVIKLRGLIGINKTLKEWSDSHKKIWEFLLLGFVSLLSIFKISTRLKKKSKEEIVSAEETKETKEEVKAEVRTQKEVKRGGFFETIMGGPAVVTDEYGADRTKFRTPAQIKAGKTKHMGIDLRAKSGTPFYSPADARVVQVFNSTAGGGGRYVKIEYADVQVTFMHLSRIDVVEGQTVRKGQQLGLTGRSGGGKENKYQPHLHIQVKRKIRGTYHFINPREMESSGLDSIIIKLMKEFITRLTIHDYQAAGFLGNFITESNLNPAAYNKAGGNYGAQGLAQWRGARIERYISIYGKQPKDDSLDNQVEFVFIELASTYKRCLNKVRQAGSAEDSADIVLGYYEFSSGFDDAVKRLKDASYLTRRSNAVKALAIYRNYSSSGENILSSVDESYIIYDNSGLRSQYGV